MPVTNYPRIRRLADDMAAARFCRRVAEVRDAVADLPDADPEAVEQALARLAQAAGVEAGPRPAGAGAAFADRLTPRRGA
jgi:hypothetical protein